MFYYGILVPVLAPFKAFRCPILYEDQDLREKK